MQENLGAIGGLQPGMQGSCPVKDAGPQSRRKCIFFQRTLHIFQNRETRFCVFIEEPSREHN